MSPRPESVPSPAGQDRHLPERVVEKLEAFWLALGWHHRHQRFLGGVKINFSSLGLVGFKSQLGPP